MTSSSQFNADITAALTELRAHALARMTNEVVVRRPTGVTEDSTTLTATASFTVVYRGAAYMQTYEGYEQEHAASGGTQVSQRLSCHFPVGAFRSLPGDVVTVLSSVDDPLLEGMHFRVAQEYPIKTKATAYRVFVDHAVGQEMPPPEEE